MHKLSLPKLLWSIKLRLTADSKLLKTDLKVMKKNKNDATSNPIDEITIQDAVKNYVHQL